MSYLMLDLCAGLGGAHQAMKARGWEVITVDNDPRFGCTYTADLTTWHYAGPTPDLVWASPPCQAFSELKTIFWPDSPPPSLDLVNAAKRIIRECRPRYHIIENVRGARKYLGPCDGKYASFCLWGYFPALPINTTYTKMGHIARTEESQKRHRNAAVTAKIPYALSEAVAVAVEQQSVMEVV